MGSKGGWLNQLAAGLLASPVGRALRAQMGAVWVENDATFTQASRSYFSGERDRFNSDRESIQADALEAWRLNPLARRIVGLTTQYVVGGGVSVGVKHAATHRFIQAFWSHRLNHMPVRCYELCDELTRTGNLFLLISTDAAGMSYLRPVPAAEIERIEARPNDIEQPVRFWPKVLVQDDGLTLAPAAWPAYAEASDERSPDGSFPAVMVHYTINRPVGGQWGESDLAPVLKWLARYSNWLEDRARLNRFRNSFLFVVKARFASEVERAARQATLAANPPAPGSILVTDESETWEVLSAKLESADAATDGQALKKMVAAGAGIPMHFLAEPEGSTRTTAEAAGGPTFRHFEQRQNYFTWMIGDILKIVTARRAQVDRGVSQRAEIEVRGGDISARDNVSLSLAGQNIINLLADLRDRGLIPDAEYLRLAYRFAGEVVDVEDMLEKAAADGAPVLYSQTGGGLISEAQRNGAAGVKKPNQGQARSELVDPETGEEKPRPENP